MAHAVGLLTGTVLIGLILADAFETIIQPRRVTRRLRLTRAFFFASWAVRSGLARLPRRQARLTFAVARHAVGDLCQVTGAAPRADRVDRLPPGELAELRARLILSGFRLREGPEADQTLEDLRALYEPYVAAMAERLRFVLPPWLPPEGEVDDWATTAWEANPAAALRTIDPACREANSPQ
jgi:hypothetical protein